MPHSTDDPAPLSWLKARLACWFWSLTPACREVARLTSEGREHPLPLGIRMRLGLHRSFCQWCERYAKQLDLVHEANGLFLDHVHEIGGPPLSGDARARMKQALQQQAGGVRGDQDAA